ncbi:hypothetical protein [Halomonas sp. WWR20]
MSKLLTGIEAHARELLERHRDQLDTLASTLEQRETLEAEDIERILASPEMTGR